MELHSPAAGGTGEAEGPEDSAVRVALRVRPLGPREPGEHVCVQVEGPQRLIAGGRVFSSDFAFDGWCTQQRLYDEACAPLVARTLAGYNASIIAYGQTGSGKTFTMGSAAVNFAPPGILGVIPRAVDHLFALLAPAPPTETCQLKLSYLEIHNDQMKDLLHPHANGRNMGIREDAAGGIFVQGVRELDVSSREHLLRLLHAGSSHRATGATLVHTASSRSHALFTLRILRRADAGADLVSSKLRLVDLAGSERAKKTGAAGSRLRESISINKGLLALGNVIAALSATAHQAHEPQSQPPSHAGAASAAIQHTGPGISLLSEGSRLSILSGVAPPSPLREGSRASMFSGGVPTSAGRSSHVPYRESKLTRLLQDSLGGNSHTLMIACVSPTLPHLDETLNTLRYATRARCIRNAPVVNTHPVPTAQLRAELAGLQAALMRARAAGWGEAPHTAGAVACLLPPPLRGGADNGPGGGEVMDDIAAARAGGGGGGGGGDETDGNDSRIAPGTPEPSRLMPPPQTPPSLAPTASAPSAPATPRGLRTASLSAGSPPCGIGSPPCGIGSPPCGIASTGRVPRNPLGRLGQTLAQWGRTEAQRAQIEDKLLNLISLHEGGTGRVGASGLGAGGEVGRAEGGRSTASGATSPFMGDLQAVEEAGEVLKIWRTPAHASAMAALLAPAPPKSPPSCFGSPTSHSGTGQSCLGSAPESWDGVPGCLPPGGGKPNGAASSGLASSPAPPTSFPPPALSSQFASLRNSLHRAADRSRMLHAEATQQLREIARNEAQATAQGTAQGTVLGTAQGNADAALGAGPSPMPDRHPGVGSSDAGLRQAQDLLAARAELQATQSALQTARAEADAAQVELAEAKADLNRDEAIFADKVRQIQALAAAVEKLNGEREQWTGGRERLSGEKEALTGEEERMQAARSVGIIALKDGVCEQGGVGDSPRGPAAEGDAPGRAAAAVERSATQGAAADGAASHSVVAAGPPSSVCPPVAPHNPDSAAADVATAGAGPACPDAASAECALQLEAFDRVAALKAGASRCAAAACCFDESSPSRPIVDELEAWDEVLMDDSIRASPAHVSATTSPPTTPHMPRHAHAELTHNGSPPGRPCTAPSAPSALPAALAATRPYTAAATTPSPPASATPASAAAAAPASHPFTALASPHGTRHSLRRKSQQVEALQNRLIALQAPPRHHGRPTPNAGQPVSPPSSNPDASPSPSSPERPTTTSPPPPARPDLPHPCKRPGAHDGTRPGTRPISEVDASTVSRSRVSSARTMQSAGALSSPTGTRVADRIRDAVSQEQNSNGGGSAKWGSESAADAAARGTWPEAAEKTGGEMTVEGELGALVQRASVTDVEAAPTAVAIVWGGAAASAVEKEGWLAEREAALSAREARFAELERVHAERMGLQLHATSHASAASARDSAFPPCALCTTSRAVVSPSPASSCGVGILVEGGASARTAPGTPPRGNNPARGMRKDSTASSDLNTGEGGIAAAVAPVGPSTAPLSPPNPTSGTPPDAATERLGRDNFFYKHSNRELKRRLREMGAEAEEERARREVAEAVATAASVAAATAGQLQARNEALAAELHNLRAFLMAHPDAEPARVNRRALRPVAWV